MGRGAWEHGSMGWGAWEHWSIGRGAWEHGSMGRGAWEHGEGHCRLLRRRAGAHRHRRRPPIGDKGRSRSSDRGFTAPFGRRPIGDGDGEGGGGEGGGEGGGDDGRGGDGGEMVEAARAVVL